MSLRFAILAGVGGAALVALGPGCTTTVPAGSAWYDISTPIATSQPVLAMAVDGTNVYWLDWSHGVWSCSKTACNDAPTAILPPTQPSSLDQSQPGTPFVNEIAVAGGWLFWNDSDNLYTCPVAGCPASGPTNLTAGSTVGSGSFAQWFASDESGIYWNEADQSVVRWTPGCSAGTCPENVFAGLGLSENGNSCTEAGCPCNASTYCAGGVCDPVSNRCVGCVASDPQASSCGEMACAPATQTCVTCNGDWGSGGTAPCPLNNPTCANGLCMQCGSSASCSTSGTTCFDGFCGSSCTSDNDCLSSEFCAYYGTQAGACVHQLPNGASCGDYGPSARICADGPCVSGSMGTVCGYENGQGTCTGNPASMCISGVCGSDGACGLANGEPCSSDTDCRTGACGLDGNCGLTPGAPCSPGTTFNACRTGACTNGNCGGYPSVSPSFGQPFAVASGQIFFTDQAGAIDACPVSGCTLANVTVVRTGAGTPADSGAGPMILGANTQSVFFSDATGMYRCDLPSCTGAEVMLGPSVAMATNAAYGSQPPMLFTSKAFWVPVASSYSAGNISIGGQNVNAYGWCSLSSCPGGAPATFAPDRALDPREVGLGETYDTLPFAVDDTSVYWASFALLGLPGSQVLSTPSPTP